MSKHRRETKTFEIASLSFIATLAGASALMLAAHARDVESESNVTTCTVVPNYPGHIPGQDIDQKTISRALGLSGNQMNLVIGYAATCHTPLTAEQFSQGITRDPKEINDSFNTTYDRCAVYGVAKQLIPADGDRTSPALLVCVDLPDAPSNIVQI